MNKKRCKRLDNGPKFSADTEICESQSRSKYVPSCARGLVGGSKEGTGILFMLGKEDISPDGTTVDQ